MINRGAIDLKEIISMLFRVEIDKGMYLSLAKDRKCEVLDWAVDGVGYEEDEAVAGVKCC
jgi:hypothetical protein